MPEMLQDSPEDRARHLREDVAEWRAYAVATSKELIKSRAAVAELREHNEVLRAYAKALESQLQALQEGRNA